MVVTSVRSMKTPNFDGLALNGALFARLAAGERDGLETTVRPRWPMDELAAPEAA